MVDVLSRHGRPPSGLPGVDDQPQEALAVTDIDTATPLTTWVRGTLTLTFRKGVTVTRSTSLEAAAVARKLIAGTRESDALRWCDSGWLQYRAEEVVFSAFQPDEDGGWPLTDPDRRALADTDYNHGVLIALLDFWQDEDEQGPVSYSARALAMLHQHALAGASPKSWQRMARLLEGEAGAQRLKEVHEAVARKPEAAAAPDTGTEPTQSGATPSDGGPGGAAAPNADVQTPHEGPDAGGASGDVPGEEPAEPAEDE